MTRLSHSHHVIGYYIVRGGNFYSNSPITGVNNSLALSEDAAWEKKIDRYTPIMTGLSNNGDLLLTKNEGLGFDAAFDFYDGLCSKDLLYLSA